MAKFGKLDLSLGRAPGVMGDIKPFVSPIDGKEISSRSQLREHERRHGVRQCGELKSAADFVAPDYEPVVGTKL